jgi:transglutaminase-like putative cysteine protease
VAESRERRSTGADWTTSLLLLVAIGLAVGGLSRVLADFGWWFVVMAIVTVVLLAAAITRSITRRSGWPALASLITGLAAVTLVFAPATAILGVIPTFGTVGEFFALAQSGAVSISGQRVPADVDAGILFLVCFGVAAVAVLMDALAIAARVPAFAGVPLLVLLLVPSIVRPSLQNALLFALVAASYLAILAVRANRRSRPAALGVAAIAVVAALLVPPVLPSTNPTEGTSGGGSGGRGPVTTGLNPILTLGDDLRRSTPAPALSYTTTATGGLYMRLTALDDFTGEAWEPTEGELVQENSVDQFPQPPGLEEAVPRTTDTTQVQVANVRSRWLPAPYAPQSVEGLVGEWAWEAESLAIRTARSSARAQEYEVESLTISPSVEQLVAAGTGAPVGFDRYLAVPDDLPAVVGEVALEVVGAASTNYDKAVALQGYFRNGEFTYSEDAPVDEGYDGSGAEVLAEFLDAKSGYCVHFSSAMAAMARTLGIPARVAVGFTPGQATGFDEGEVEYEVSTYNLHAWPELYFAGVGWVRFEPTPGRGRAPAFAPSTVDDPSTPDVNEAEPPAVDEPTATPTDAATRPPEATPERPEAGGDVSAPVIQPAWFFAALLLLLLVPWAWRAIRRSRRLGAVDDGSAGDAWDELRDTADDLGLATSDTRTPRQVALDLAPHLDDRGRAAFDRLRAALETEVFAGRAAQPLADDVRAVLWSLRRRAGVARTLVAALAPRSLFARWTIPVSRVD